MSVKPSRSAFVLGLCLAACQSAPPPAPEAPPSPPPTDSALVADYGVLWNRTMREGREVTALVLAGDAAALHQRFIRSLADAFPEDRLKKMFTAAIRQAPIGARVDDGALVAAAGNRTYVADFKWGEQPLSIAVGFNATGSVSSFGLRGRDALPAGARLIHPAKTPLRLPFDGTWWVYWGGRTERENYHAMALDERYACDFAVWRSGGTFQGDGTRNEDYWAWGQPVLAPAAGTVAAAVGDVQDNHPRFESSNMQAPAGNHVVLEVAKDEFAVLAHLQKGSLRVMKGQSVKKGEVLGLCGNSGNSTEPHVHLHIQDRPELYQRAVGLPMVFARYLADGKPVEKTSPRQGQFVRHEGGAP